MGVGYEPKSVLLEFLFHDLELGLLVSVPLYYFFRISTSNSLVGKYFYFYLFAPFVIDTIINIGIVSYFPIEVINTHSGIIAFYEIETVVSIVFNLFLNYKSYQLVMAYSGDSMTKEWLFRIWQSVFLLLIAWVLMTLVTYLLGSELLVFIYGFYVVISIWMFWFIYSGIVNMKLIDDRRNISLKLQEKSIKSGQERPILSEKVVAKEIAVGRNEREARKLNEDLFNKHFNEIKALVTSKSLYRNEDLSIDDVAGQFEMSAGYISKIIKKASGKNFPKWINEFRVADVKAMFGDNEFEHYTTLSIGLEAGFKSKSAFYVSFKSIAGETPAKFRKKKS